MTNSLSVCHGDLSWVSTTLTDRRNSSDYDIRLSFLILPFLKSMTWYIVVSLLHFPLLCMRGYSFSNARISPSPVGFTTVFPCLSCKGASCRFHPNLLLFWHVLSSSRTAFDTSFCLGKQMAYTLLLPPGRSLFSDTKQLPAKWRREETNCSFRMKQKWEK